MRTVPFQQVLFGLTRLLGMNPNRDLSSERAATFCEYINGAIGFAWRFDFWPEWLLTERRRYRPNYTSGLFIEPTTELFYVPAQKYYQALQLQLSATEAPATLTSGEWVVNAAYWAEVAADYEADWWDAATTYEVGDQVRNPDDGEYYQCHTGPVTNPTFVAASFGLLTPFDRYIDSNQEGHTEIDAVKQISRRDPRVYPTNPWPLSFTKSDRGYQLPADAPNEVWVQFRTVAPTFTLTRWASGTAYNLGARVYYQTTGTDGDVFQSAIGNNDQPVDGVTNWLLVPFPSVLQDYVQRAAMADALRDQKQTDRARAELVVADEELQDALDQELAQQGQSETATVKV